MRAAARVYAHTAHGLFCFLGRHQISRPDPYSSQLALAPSPKRMVEGRSLADGSAAELRMRLDGHRSEVEKNLEQ